MKVNSSSPRNAKALTEMEIRYAHGVDGKSRSSKQDDLIAALQSLGQFSGLLCPPASVLDEANRAAAKAANVISLPKSVNAGISSDCHGDASFKAGYVSQSKYRSFFSPRMTFLEISLQLF